MSSPIYRAGSLMKETVDLGARSRLVACCRDVIELLKHEGELSQSEFDKAIAYLRLHEDGGLRAATIPRGAVIHLDSVALAHLQHLRVLGKLQAIGSDTHVLESDLRRAQQLIKYDSVSQRAGEIVFKLRTTLASGIADGTVRLSPSKSSATEGADVSDHPSVQVLEILQKTGAAIIDDRCMNAGEVIPVVEGAQVTIATTLDVVEALPLTDAERRQVRLRLRKFGLAFVPFSSDELVELLEMAPVVSGAVVETAELKALRESVLLYSMCGTLQLPLEGRWLSRVLGALVGAVEAQWRPGADWDVAGARSSWCLELSDPRGWLQLPAANVEEVVPAGWVALVMWGAALGTDVRHAYFRWLDEALLEPLRDKQPVLYKRLIHVLGERVFEIADGAERARGDIID